MVLRKAWIHGGDGDDHKVQMLNMVTLEVKMTDGWEGWRQAQRGRYNLVGISPIIDRTWCVRKTWSVARPTWSNILGICPPKFKVLSYSSGTPTICALIRARRQFLCEDGTQGCQSVGSGRHFPSLSSSSSEFHSDSYSADASKISPFSRLVFSKIQPAFLVKKGKVNSLLRPCKMNARRP